MSITCINCGQAELESGTVKFAGEIRGESHTIAMHGLVCPKCGYQTIDGPEMDEFGRLLADEYRKAHGLLTSDEIHNRRLSLGLTQVQFAMLLGVGVASVKRWELGKIQERRSDELIRDKTRRTVVPCFDDFFTTTPTSSYGYALGTATFVSAFIKIDPSLQHYISGVGAGYPHCEATSSNLEWEIGAAISDTLPPSHVAAMFSEDETLKGRIVRHVRK